MTASFSCLFLIGSDVTETQLIYTRGSYVDPFLQLATSKLGFYTSRFQGSSVPIIIIADLNSSISLLSLLVWS